MDWRRVAEPLDLRYFIIAVAVAAVHLFTGIALLIGGRALLATTPLHFTADLFGNRHVVAAVLMTAAIMAVVPFLILHPPRLLFVLMLAPQQILLSLHFVSVVTAIAAGQYPDGYVPAGGAYFIFADQAWLLMVIAVHTWGYIETR